MTHPHRFILVLIMAAAFAPIVHADDAQTSKEARLRDALKAAYDQIRTLQEQTVTLQAAQAESDRDKETLKAQAQAAADALSAQSAKSTLVLQTAMGQINELKVQNAMLHRQVDADEQRNVELDHVANEILTRYEKFSMGDAITAKEPFTQLTRVKLENLVQGYQDKIAAQQVGVNTPPATLPDSATGAK